MFKNISEQYVPTNTKNINVSQKTINKVCFSEHIPVFFFYKLSLMFTVLSHLIQRQGSTFGNHTDPFPLENEAANISQAFSQWPLNMGEAVNNNMNICSHTSNRYVYFHRLVNNPQLNPCSISTSLVLLIFGLLVCWITQY